MYKFDRRIREGSIKELDDKYGYIMRYEQMDNPERKDYFVIVPANKGKERGLFVSNYVYYGKPTSKCYEQYLREIGTPVKQTKEQMFLEELHGELWAALPNTWVERVENIDDTMKLKLSDPKVRKVYDTYCGRNKNKPYLKPDFRVVDFKTGKIAFLEVERTKHRQADFLKKLMKIRMMGRKTYFVFNGDENATHHLELIALFERQISELIGKRFKFTYIYYATVDSLKFLGKDAWEKYV
jgi:hypothetical protein